MSVPADIIFIWPGTNAAIPAGWTRCDGAGGRPNFDDGKYALGKSAGGDGGGTGGSANHDHPNLAHTHTSNWHTHTFSAGASSGTQNQYALSRSRVSQNGHTHASATSWSAQITYDSSDIDWTATSNDPPYYEVIFVQSDGTNDIGDDMVGFFEASGDAAANWQFCDGSSSSPDLRNRFLRGATAAGDSGGTGGSSDNHTHGSSNHSHTSSHTHAAKTSNVPTGGIRAVTGGGGLIAQNDHRHNVSLSAQALSTSSDAVTSNAADGQPPFKKLIPYQNQTGAEDTPDKIIGMWTGAHAAIPTNWDRYTGMDDYFEKCPNVVGDALGTGGANQHTHTQTHNHTAANHNHPYSAGGATTTEWRNTSTPSATVAAAAHSHTWTIGSTATTVNNNTDSVANNTSKSNYPPYVEVIFIQYTAPAGINRKLMSIGL